MNNKTIPLTILEDLVQALTTFQKSGHSESDIIQDARALYLKLEKHLRIGHEVAETKTETETALKIKEQTYMENGKISYDKIYKDIFTYPIMVKDLILEYYPSSSFVNLDFSTLEECNNFIINEQFNAYIDDKVWKVNWKDGGMCYVVLILEFQSYVDPWMSLRMLNYVTGTALRLIIAEKISPQEGAPFILPIVIYNGIAKWNAPLQVFDIFARRAASELDTKLPMYEFFLLDEADIANNSAHAGKGLMSQLISLEHPRTVEELMQTVKHLTEILQDNYYYKLRKAFKILFVHSAVKFQFIPDTLEIPDSYDLKETMDMLNPRVEMWKNKYRLEGEKIGEARGEKIGEARGNAKGTVTAGRSILKDLLLARFDVPYAHLSVLDQIDNPNILRKLSVDVLKSDSLEDFMSRVQSYGYGASC